MKRILVVGGTGTTGREVIAQLSANKVDVRALVRDPGRSRLPSGVEVLEGDLTAPASMDAALRDVDAVFLVWVAPRDAVAAALERIAAHTRRIVFLSSPYKTPHPMFQQPNPVRGLHEEIERRIEASGVEWTLLRPGMFAANARHWWAPQIRAGNLVRWPYLSAPTAPIHQRDIAAVAVRALCDDGHAGAEYVITGPESLAQSEQVAMIGRAIGRDLRIEEISPEEARREWSDWPPFVVNMLLDAWAAAVGQPALVTSTVAEVTGAPPRTFLEWATDYASEFRT